MDGRVDGRSIDRSIERCILRMLGPLFSFSGRRFRILGGHFGALGIDFGVILVSLGLSWRSWDPRGSPKEAGWKKLPKRWFVGPGRDPPWAPKSTKFRMTFMVSSRLGFGMRFRWSTYRKVEGWMCLNHNKNCRVGNFSFFEL